MIEELLHDGREDFLGDSGTDVDAVVTILENFWLDDWYETILLADRTVSGERMSGLSDGHLGWKTVGWVNLKDSSPLGESAAHFVVLGAPLAKSI